MAKIYLAAPYSDPAPAVRKARVDATTRIAAFLMSKGHVVFSPITHGHAVAPQLDFAKIKHDHDFWMKQCLPMLGCCDLLVIVPLPGWEKSRGIADERRYASDCNMPELFWSTYPRPDPQQTTAWDDGPYVNDDEATIFRNLPSNH